LRIKSVDRLVEFLKSTRTSQKLCFHGVVAFVSIFLGCVAAAIVVNDANGYVAAYTWFFLFILIVFMTLILLISAFVCVLIETKRHVGAFLLTAAILIPGSFMASSMTAKYFEIGSYTQQPMVPIPATK
jgi:hypothetical protein